MSTTALIQRAWHLTPVTVNRRSLRELRCDLYERRTLLLTRQGDSRTIAQLTESLRRVDAAWLQVAK